MRDTFLQLFRKTMSYTVLLIGVIAALSEIFHSSSSKGALPCFLDKRGSTVCQKDKKGLVHNGKIIDIDTNNGNGEDK